MKIVPYPHSVLTNPTLPVTSETVPQPGLVIDMLSTMFKNNGIGLSANQIGLEVVPKLYEGMVEDILKALEKMCPRGFLIVYNQPNGQVCCFGKVREGDRVLAEVADVIYEELGIDDPETDWRKGG